MQEGSALFVIAVAVASAPCISEDPDFPFEGRRPDGCPPFDGLAGCAMSARSLTLWTWGAFDSKSQPCPSARVR